MLSILIPTYNYNVYPLVADLNEQSTLLKIVFEIIVLDDCSSNPFIENENINNLEYARYEMLPKNIGRSAIRNKLAREAKFDNLLFLDADTLISSEHFIKIYSSHFTEAYQIVYGGITYQKEKPSSDQLLRWKYGKKREALAVIDRNKNPYLRFLTLNFLIRKEVFDQVNFNETIPNLRHEDTLFAMDLKKRNIKIKHIENPVVHLGIESSKVFLEKSIESVDALSLFIDQNLIQARETKLSRKALNLRFLKIAPLVLFFYRAFKKTIKTNLLSDRPSLFLFDIYRLGYFLEIKSNKNA